MEQFLDANYNKQVPIPDGHGRTRQIAIFIEGGRNFQEPELERRYEVLPTGLLGRFVLRSDSGPSSGASRAETSMFLRRSLKSWRAWREAAEHYQTDGTAAAQEASPVTSLLLLPDLSVFNSEWWESTIPIIFHDHLQDAAFTLLDLALNDSAAENQLEQVARLAQAAIWMELCLLLLDDEARAASADNDADRGTLLPASAALLKNLGLAYMHLVKAKAPELSDDDGQTLRSLAMDDGLLPPWPPQGGEVVSVGT